MNASHDDRIHGFTAPAPASARKGGRASFGGGFKFSLPPLGESEVFITNFLFYFLEGAPCLFPPLQTAETRTRTVVFIWAAAARGGASFRSADAAQVCNNVDFVAVDGPFECSVATAARQIVSEKMARGGRAEAPGPRSDISFRLDQKTANFKAATASRLVKWSATNW